MTEAAARRVVITGMGAVTSLGAGVERNWDAILAGKSGVGQIRQFKSDDFPVHIGSEVDLEQLTIPDVGDVLRPFATRSVKLGVWALDEAWRDAGLGETEYDPWRAGLIVGASNFPVIDEGAYSWPTEALHEGSYKEQYLAICRKMPELLAQRDIGMVSTLLAGRHLLHGPCMTVQSACASATQAIGEALHMIRRGDTDLMVAGGADSMLSAVCVTGFTLLSVASPFQGDPAKACRPFDRKRDGLVLGEGAGLVILEELSHAQRRGARIHAELVGYGSSCDGYRFTDSHPDGRGAIQCMRAALADAGIAPEEVDYINAHGTATLQNDRVETLAVKQTLGDHAYRVPMSSTKSQIGHLLCASGGIELVVTVLALSTGIVPPTINLEHPDPDCDLDYVPNEARRVEPHTALSNSFGFGGQNGTLIVTRWPD
ncbi:MAG TPA: beta-ketoacyl-[acyl-carrier-protein] synthase family protein [bacterium]|nr:beta-ketoacyl-[acyl-carrier-protein] synthase family protein [bacterium]